MGGGDRRRPVASVASIASIADAATTINVTHGLCEVEKVTK